MQLPKFERDVINSYKKTEGETLEEKVEAIVSHVESEWNTKKNDLTSVQLKVLADAIISQETATLHDELQELMAKKERIERQIERKREAFQESKYQIFNAIESSFEGTDEAFQTRLHQVKLQSLDLFDMLEEMIESAIIITLEKGIEIEDTIREFSKEITYETLSEGELSSIRIQSVIATMLHTAVDIAEATPNKAEEVLRGTLRGIRSGLVRTLARFKKQLLYMPEEVKSHFEAKDPLVVDQLFTQVIRDLSLQSSSSSCKEILGRVSKEIHYDMEELMQISKETMELMRERIKWRGSKVMGSKTAQEAKRMGVTAWSSAKTALNSAIKSAKEKIEKN